MGTSELRLLFLVALVVFAALAILLEAVLYRALRRGPEHRDAVVTDRGLDRPEDISAVPASASGPRSCRVAVYRAAMNAGEERARPLAGLGTGTARGRSRAGR
jgi:hypothetical protein